MANERIDADAATLEWERDLCYSWGRGLLASVECDKMRSTKIFLGPERSLFLCRWISVQLGFCESRFAAATPLTRFDCLARYTSFCKVSHRNKLRVSEKCSEKGKRAERTEERTSVARKCTRPTESDAIGEGDAKNDQHCERAISLGCC